MARNITRNNAKGRAMNKEKTWLSCREVGELLNCTQRHALNLIKNGKLSADRDEGGKYYVQKSEFFRVFPDAKKVEIDRNESKLPGKEDMKFLEEKLKHLEEMMNEKNKQNEFLKEQLINFTEEKSKMLDAINGHTRLLEYKETSGKPAPSSAEKSSKKAFDWWPWKRK